MLVAPVATHHLKRWQRQGRFHWQRQGSENMATASQHQNYVKTRIKPCSPSLSSRCNRFVGSFLNGRGTMLWNDVWAQGSVCSCLVCSFHFLLPGISLGPGAFLYVLSCVLGSLHLAANLQFDAGRSFGLICSFSPCCAESVKRLIQGLPIHSLLWAHLIPRG